MNSNDVQKLLMRAAIALGVSATTIVNSDSESVENLAKKIKPIDTKEVISIAVIFHKSDIPTNRS